jgi:hypothetical protein
VLVVVLGSSVAIAWRISSPPMRARIARLIPTAHADMRCFFFGVAGAVVSGIGVVISGLDGVASRSGLGGSVVCIVLIPSPVGILRSV